MIYNISTSKELLNYVTRWGSKCNECADHNGTCPTTGISCDNKEKAIQHVIGAINYGINNNFLNSDSIYPVKNAIKVNWIQCPICGENGMRCETDENGLSLVFCTNHGCKSNQRFL